MLRRRGHDPGRQPMRFREGYEPVLRGVLAALELHGAKIGHRHLDHRRSSVTMRPPEARP